MKKAFLLLTTFLFTTLSFTQNHSSQTGNKTVDALLQKIDVEKDDSKRMDLIVSIFSPEFETNPKLIIETGKQLLRLSLKNKDAIGEASAYSFFGHGYRLSGNYSKGLDYHHKALVIAEKNGNYSLIGLVQNQMGHIYKDREENEKAISLYLSALENAAKGTNVKAKVFPLANLGAVYLANNQLDLSLKCSQRAYEKIMKLPNRFMLGYVFLNLGGVQSKLGNVQLATTYYDMAAKEGAKSNSIRHLNLAYTGKAQHFNNYNQRDSCIVYAKKAIKVVANTDFFYLSVKPAKLLSETYEKTNCDSTLKYSKIYKIANDSLFNSKVIQQIQLMTFEEDMRQQELASEKLIDEQKDKVNLQYIFIAIGILTLLMLYLLLSRSFITNTKLIEFFGIVALLIVFEFFNLLLHSFLEKTTDHSPILMLLALVLIAAMLVPLHFRIEKWATKKLVEKNKQIRLANAKKTIEKLDPN